MPTKSRMNDEGETTQIQKSPSPQGKISRNHRPIMCLLMMWKILTVQIREEIYYSLICRGLYLEEQKRFSTGTKRTNDLLYTDQYMLKGAKMRRGNVAMVLIDNKKGCDMVPQTWITESLKTYKISDKNFISNVMENKRVKLTAEDKSLQ